MKRPITTVLAAALLSLGGAAAAQPFSTPPPPGPPRPLTIAAPSSQVLSNGLRVVVAERSGVPLVTAALVILSGSEADPPQLAGLASLTAGLLTQGTQRYGAPELAAAAEALGGSLDSGAGWGQSVVSITVTTPAIDAALGLLAEAALQPTFAQAELERLRAQTLDGLKVSNANPGYVAGLLAARLAYGTSVWGHPAGGTASSLPRIGRQDVIALHRATFRPDRAVLIFTGDIGAASALELARRHFGRWLAPDLPPPVVPPVPSVASTVSSPALAAVDMPEAGQTAVVLSMPLPARRGADWATTAVLNTVLGGGYSSRLNEEIRVKRGLSYGAGSSIDTRGDGALFQAAVQTKNESAGEVVQLLQAEVDRLRRSEVPAGELAARKAALIGGFSRSVETTSGLATAIRSLVVTGRSPAELTTRIVAIEAVSAADIERYAAANFEAGARHVAVAGATAQFLAELQTKVPAAVVVVEPIELERDRPIGR